MTEVPPLIRVLVVDRRERTRDVLDALERADGVAPLGVVGRLDDAAASVAESDVVVVDAGVDVVDAVERLRRAAPEAKVLLLGPPTDVSTIAEALAAGACGSVETVDGLAHAVRRAVAGELVLPSSHLAGVLAHLRGERRPDDGAALRRLTARETEILRRLALGHAPPEIAEDLGISALTVQSHLKSILAKLGVHSKIEAVTLAWRSGLAPSSRTA